MPGFSNYILVQITKKRSVFIDYKQYHYFIVLHFLIWYIQNSTTVVGGWFTVVGDGSHQKQVDWMR